jgi:N-acetyl-anhydromuramyl-L-alanine amidase AmpD
VLHHTGSVWWGNLKILSGQAGKPVSVHFLIQQDWKAFKLANPEQITWHAWESQRGNLVWMNSYSLGIEIEGNADTKFTDKQYAKVIDLIRYLQTAFKIPKENVICHHDITRAGSPKKKLRDWVSSCRKPDLAPVFRHAKGYKNFVEFRAKNLV